MKGYSFRSLTDLVLKIFKTEVNAGTGLSGGGSLEADRTLSVKYGTAAGTAAQGNDSRLSNSREWTAATISQAEVEVGTATTRRAFTAQRVRQAIVAWWSSITGVFGRDLVTSVNNTDARDKLGLFTSALRWPAWAEVSNKPATFDPSSHTHPWSQVTGQPVTATRWPSLAEVTGTPANYPTTWNSVADKPAQATRWPALAEVTDKPINYPTTWDSVAAKPAQATRWPTFAEVSNKPSTYTPSSHTHPTSQITGLDAALNTKAITSTQVIAGTGLSGGGDLSANRTLSVDYGSTAGTAAQGNDSRIVNSVQTSGNQTVTGIKTFSSFPVTPSTAPTATYQAANKKYVDDKVVGSAIGVGQTWQVVTSQRSLDTNYTNNTGKAIMVVQVSEYFDLHDPVEVFVDNVKIMHVDQGFGPGWFGPVSFVVPNGSSYRIEKNVHPNIKSWAELR